MNISFMFSLLYIFTKWIEEDPILIYFKLTGHLLFWDEIQNGLPYRRGNKSRAIMCKNRIRLSDVIRWERWYDTMECHNKDSSPLSKKKRDGKWNILEKLMDA